MNTHKAVRKARKTKDDKAIARAKYESKREDKKRKGKREDE